MSHCQGCGYQGPRDSVSQAGSDVVPLTECPECGEVTAIGCNCQMPDSH